MPITMDNVSAGLMKKIRKQLLEKEGDRLGIQFQVKEWNAEHIAFTIKLMLNIPYIDIEICKFSIRTPKGDQPIELVQKESDALAFDVKVPIKMIFGVANKAFRKGLALDYDLNSVVHMKAPGNLLAMKVPIAVKGKINLTKLSKWDFGKIFMDKALCHCS